MKPIVAAPVLVRMIAMTPIRTKIVATIGPASSSREMIARLAGAGCDVFRVNFSHGDADQRQAFLENVRAVERDRGEPLAVMADLCGPKIRLGVIGGGSVRLEEGQQVVIQREPVEGSTKRLSTTLEELPAEVRVGETLLIDDGRVRLTVESADGGAEAVCRVVRGGVVSTGKGINLPDTDLTVASLTAKDRRDVDFIAERDFDYVALSFVRSADDVSELRGLLAERDCDAHVVAKIEKRQAVEDIEEIIDVADAVMVARGDLGVEMNLPEVPLAQKRITSLCLSGGKPCIIATQMLESMTHAATPTRAEVSDVANAVLDCADAVMLSGETAVGEYPAEAVAMMNETVARVQAYADETTRPLRVTHAPAVTTAALAAAVLDIVEIEDVAAAAVFTATGATARMLAKNRLPRPILAMSPSASAVRRMCLYYGVEAVRADAPQHTREVLALASRLLVERGLARRGDRIVVLSGRPIGQPGATNTLVVHEIA